MLRPCADIVSVNTAMIRKTLVSAASIGASAAWEISALGRKVNARTHRAISGNELLLHMVDNSFV